MKKRIVSLILCGLMVFSAAGCSGGGENKAGKDDVTLTMWTHINEPRRLCVQIQRRTRSVP